MRRFIPPPNRANVSGECLRDELIEVIDKRQVFFPAPFSHPLGTVSSLVASAPPGRAPIDGNPEPQHAANWTGFDGARIWTARRGEQLRSQRSLRVFVLHRF